MPAGAQNASCPGPAPTFRYNGSRRACRFRRRCFDVHAEPRKIAGRTARDRDSQPQRSNDMRYMVIVKASKESEAGVMPTEQMLTEMGKYNEELVKAGVMLAMEGLHPTSKGIRV